jgi:two-component system cell cycle sensor histidine kinase/response regulator CckA
VSGDLAARYGHALASFLASPGEEGLEQAYEIGREAIASGLGVLDLTRMHTLASQSSADPRAWEFMVEALAPFEMALRGFQEANTALRNLATTLEDRVAARTAELQRAEESRRAQAILLRAVLDSMTDGVAVMNGAGEVTTFNDAGARLFDDRVAPEGGPPYGTFREDETTPISSHDLPLPRALHGEAVHDVELYLRNANLPDGIHLSVSAAPLHNGSERGAVAVFRDVTARRKAEESAKRSEERLQQAQKMDAIGQLAGGVAHDFNNLLAVITSYTELVIAELAPYDPRLVDLGEIMKASQSATALTRQLLSFSRKQVVQPQILDLNSVIQDISRMLRRTIGEHIDLATALDPSVGAILADKSQIEQIAMNLAVNARDAMPSGGKLMIETRRAEIAEPQTPGEAPPGRYVVLAVSDTGIGMDAATRARIFEPFFTTKEAGRGTGLGLATVYGIVQQSRGHIAVYSEPGHGTTFRIYFPEIEEERLSTEEQAVARKHGGTETILLVEDDEALRVAGARILGAAGYTVLLARDLVDAIGASSQQEAAIDLLLTDVVLPGGSGPQLAQWLRALRPQMRVLYTSGYSDAGVVHLGAIPPGTPFIQKPFSTDALLQKVREVLDEAGV